MHQLETMMQHSILCYNLTLEGQLLFSFGGYVPLPVLAVPHLMSTA
jgi:hypothetical protein